MMRDYFASLGSMPYTVVYEDFVAAYQQIVATVRGVGRKLLA
jgi:hypothetical protein